MNEEKRPFGEIVVHDERGYGYIPKIVRKEVGLNGTGRIPFYLDANCVLLVRSGATKEEIMNGLDILKSDIKTSDGKRRRRRKEKDDYRNGRPRMRATKKMAAQILWSM